MATYYIDPSGNDTTGDGSSGTPWASLSHACGQATAAGDIIHINAGTYADDTDQCVVAVGVSIEGDGVDTTTIVTSRTGTSVSYYIQGTTDRTGETGCHANASTNTISGFTLDGSSRSCYRGIWFQGRNNVIVHDMKIRDIRDVGIRISGWNYDFGGWSSTTDEAPPYWGEGCSIYNIEIDNCSYETGPTWAICIGTLKGCDIYNVTCDMTLDGGTGCAIGTQLKWLDSCTIHDCTLSTLAQDNAFCIEWKDCQNDCKIYNNTFNFLISVVRGGPVTKVDGSDWHLQIYNNTTNMAASATAMEVPHRFTRIFRNYIDGGRIFTSVDTNAEACLTSDDTLNTQIDNNVIYDPEWWGISVDGLGIGLDGLKIFHNVLDGPNSYQPGIQLYHNGDTFANVEIKNNIIMNYNSYAINLDTGEASVTVSGNYFHGNTNDSVQNPGSATVADNVDGDPQLNESGDRPNPYYVPSSGTSNCVDDSTNSQDVSSDVYIDYLGNIRTGTYDIGAFEYGATAGEGGMSDYLENKLIDHVLKNSAYTAPTNLYVALYTAAPSDAGSGTEVSGGGYARVNHNSWDAASGGQTSNTGAIIFATATAAWGTVVAMGILDASSAGNLIFWDSLESRITVSTGDKFTFADGAIDITLT